MQGYMISASPGKYERGAQDLTALSWAGMCCFMFVSSINSYQQSYIYIYILTDFLFCVFLSPSTIETLLLDGML